MLVAVRKRNRLKQVRQGLRSWSRNFLNLGKLIHNCNWVLLFLDGLEKQRSLSDLEWVLRNLTKRHLTNLLERKRIYWRQRNTIRRVKFGDENTSFFQAIATINHRKNYIVSISTPDSTLLTDHDQKANYIFESFKKRLGVSEFAGNVFDLDGLLS